MPADDAATFDEHRGYLFGVAYRMLSSAADAEDVVQEAFLRWSAAPRDDIDAPRGFLTTIVVRLCLDELRSARVRRETYVGPWLPEPLVVDEDDPANAVELADSLSLAFLVVLEELAPAERAAFLLHDVFEYGYPEIASMLGRQEPACRQLVSRARQRVGDRHRRFDADRAMGQQLATRFVVACSTGDVDQLMDLLAEDVVVWTDGGGKARAARNPIYGAAKSIRFLVAITQDVPATATVRQTLVNGQPGVLIVEGDAVTTAVALDIIDGVVVGVRVVANPDKLAAIRP
ncbi:MAG: RNA polymerase sigma-70 factor [Frankiaceae bacterium]|nr:RNA polymerase sigma-70 factor [Frankiaceae bacterium]MBV9870502.1 RNA polymerase sigma-70 factor [Frankiaceae bacterium]